MGDARHTSEQLDLILDGDDATPRQPQTETDASPRVSDPKPWRRPARRVDFQSPRTRDMLPTLRGLEHQHLASHLDDRHSTATAGVPTPTIASGIVLINVAGEVRVVSDDWTPEEREREFLHVLSQLVGQEVTLAACTSIANPGSLKVVSGPLPVLVRLTCSAIDKQDRACMIITAEHHRALVAHMARGGVAYQVCVTRVDPPRAAMGVTAGHLLTVAIPYQRLAPIIERKLQTAPARHRINVGMFIERTPTGPRLLLSGGGGMDLTAFAGMQDLAALLRTGRLNPWSRIRAHRTWVGMTAAVLTRREGLECTVSHLDARKLVDQEPMFAVGAARLVPHRISRVRGRHADTETLLRTDVIGAHDAHPLLDRWDAPLTLCEVEVTTTDPIEKLARRMLAAEALGLTVGECLIVADERRMSSFARRLPMLRPEFADRIRMISTREVYHAWSALADAHALRLLAEEQRTE